MNDDDVSRKQLPSGGWHEDPMDRGQSLLEMI